MQHNSQGLVAGVSISTGKNKLGNAHISWPWDTGQQCFLFLHFRGWYYMAAAYASDLTQAESTSSL